ncbi:MAG: hypothetical protein HY606_02440, partial [Planctomycetes bacterium]|nr:hypothetical protein [Planctomycetota bacterium]
NKLYTVVSALPYSIYKDICIGLWGNLDSFRQFFLIIQSDVFAKLTAQSGKHYGPLSVIVQYLFEITKLIELPPNAFYPQPSIYSTFFHLKPKPNQKQLNVRQTYDRLKFLFSSRRKCLSKDGRRAEELKPLELIEFACSP